MGTQVALLPMVVSELPEDHCERRRKSHKKSRLGCRNCKLRGVKCDEFRPTCKQCSKFRVDCSYQRKGFDLQASYDTVTDLGLALMQTCSATEVALSLINDSVDFGPIDYKLDIHDLNRLNKFRTRTIFTMGTATNVHIYQKEVIRLACSQPFVMHAVMALVRKHERYLSGLPYGEPDSIEIYHEYQAALLLNQKLSGRICNNDRDAIGAVGILLGALTLASTEAGMPEEAWPLKNSTPDDLQWLKLSEGKRELWRIADPFRAESCFRPHIEELMATSHTTDQTGLSIEKLPAQLLELCDVKVISNPENNPYFRAIQILATLHDLECNQANCLSFFAFVTDMHPCFKDLLKSKDSRALLLMAFWYAKVCHYQWWIAHRATMECRAICIYLQKRYADETSIQDLLQFPKTKCALAS